MSADVLRADLASVGITLRREGDDLLVKVPVGASLDPYRERLRAHKPALLAELLKGEIIAALHTDSCDFDRDAYLALVERWRACGGEESER
jgi:hypothetical protein